jgi:uncharacterized protein
MSSGLLALLDDIAAIAKSAAASIDDVAVQAVDASGRAAGVVIDDAAVTPKYVVGLSPKRELPIVWKIAKGSLRNKLLFLMPTLLLLGYLAPWLVTPLLAIGGVYLCFEGTEKLFHAISQRWGNQHQDHGTSLQVIDPAQLEQIRTQGAIRTDFILSAEIMAIAFAPVAQQPLSNQIAILCTVALIITAAVYGFVALILKVDDLGLHLASKEKNRSVAWFGRMLVRLVAPLLELLSVVGTLAMLWVGGQIIVHAISPFHHGVEHWIHHYQLRAFSAWFFQALIGTCVGIVVGAVVMGCMKGFTLLRPRPAQSVSH